MAKLNRVLDTFYPYLSIHMEDQNILKKFSIVEDTETKGKSIVAEVVCIDGKVRNLNYSISLFENTSKINIGELLGANLVDG